MVQIIKTTWNNLFLFVSLFLPVMVLGQTIQISNTTDDLNGVFFLNDNTGWIVGENSTILKTIDGGENWRRINYSRQYCFCNVQFVDEMTGWIVATDGFDWGTGNGLVLKTSDGGDNWSIITRCENAYSIRSAFFVNDTTGWLTDEGGSDVNHGSRIYKTTDGGNNWHIQKDDWTFSRCIYFIDENNGWAGGYSEMLHTDDGGEHWTLQTLQSDMDHFAMHFSSAQDGWSGGNYLEKTNNGGNTWSIVDKPRSSRPESGIGIINSVFFINENSGAIGGRSLYITNDSGVSWERLNVDGKNYSDIFICNMNNAWSVGDDGLIVKFALSDYTSASSNNRSAMPKTTVLYPNYPNPFNPSTTIRFDLAKSENVQLKIYNIHGQKIRILISDIVSSGEHSVHWQADGLPAGIYLARLEAGSQIKTMKLVLQK